MSVNSVAIYAQRIITPLHEWNDGLVYVRDGTIAYVGNERLSVPEGTSVHTGELLIPGMIDLHINGCGGGDAAEGSVEALEKMSRSLAEHGTTAFVPTVITDQEAELVRSLEALSEVLPADYSGARPLGIHLEGPFLNPAKRGAHRLECLHTPSLDLVKKFEAAAGENLKMLTLAPEILGGLQVIDYLAGRIPLISLGHSACDYATALAAIERGANFATHLFNAMPEIHHREPGLVGAVLDTGIATEIIADGIHIHPAAVRLAVRCKGSEKIVLVTDAISAAGMPDGAYRIGNLTVVVQDGVCRNEEGRLAGSSLTMDAGLRNMASWMEGRDLELKRLVAMSTSQPADLLGLQGKGRIEKGCDADLVLLDSRLQVERTWAGGKLVYERVPG